MDGYYLFGDSVTLEIDESGRYAAAPTFIGTALHKSPAEFSKFLAAALKNAQSYYGDMGFSALRLIRRTAYSS